MSRKNLELQLAERPKANVIPGQTFKLVESDAPTAGDLKDGQILVETYYLSLDPGPRSWLYGKFTHSGNMLFLHPYGV